MPVNPGRLRHRITIQAVQRVITPGGYEDQWTDVQTVWASVTVLNATGVGRYAMAGFTSVTHEILLRAGPDLSLTGTRIKWGDTLLQPVRPPSDAEARGRTVTIAAQEVPDLGVTLDTGNGNSEGEGEGEHG